VSLLGAVAYFELHFGERFHGKKFPLAVTRGVSSWSFMVSLVLLPGIIGRSMSQLHLNVSVLTRSRVTVS
jgi:hypothetical protein